jgi:hypothetical protein
MHYDIRCMLTRAARSAGTQLWFFKLSLHLFHAGRSNGRLVSDKQLSSCAVGVDLDVGSGYSARLMGWRLVYPLTASQDPNVPLHRLVDH